MFQVEDMHVWKYKCEAHHDDGSQQSGAGAHHEKAVDKPGGPNDTIGDPNGFQGLLQAEFLLQNYALNYHRHGVDPSQNHEDGETAIQRQHETGGRRFGREKK